MSHRSRITSALIAIVALALATSRATAAPFLPLTPGTVWVYQGDQGGHQTERMIGFFPIHGRSTAIKTYDEGADTGLQNYWMLAFDGSVLLAGFYRPSDVPGSLGSGFSYEPPIRVFPVPPVLGPQPPQSIEVHDFVTDALLFTGSIRVDVLEDVMLTLPIGTLHAYGAGQVASSPALSATGARLTLDGRAVTGTVKASAGSEPTDWYSEGVGLVQYRTSQLYQLASVSGPTATAASTWARIKRMYR